MVRRNSESPNSLEQRSNNDDLSERDRYMLSPSNSEAEKQLKKRLLEIEMVECDRFIATYKAKLAADELKPSWWSAVPDSGLTLDEVLDLQFPDV